MSNSNGNNENTWRRYTPGATATPSNGKSEKGAGAPVSSCPGPITTAAANDQLRRISVSTFGLPSTSPSLAPSFSFGSRRGSGHESVDENAIDDDDGGRSNPTTPFVRRMSLGAQAIRSARGGSSAGIPGEASCFSFPEQFKIRAESSVQGQRPNFSSSIRYAGTPHPRTGSISELPAPPSGAAPAASGQPRQNVPDEFQERILKGHFYLD